MGPVSAVAELPLDLDAFEGPFDLLLTLVLKEELELADVEIVEIVLTFLEARRGDLEIDDAAGELAERLAQYRRFRAAAGWLEDKLEAESDRYFRLGPAPLAPVP